MSKDQHGGNYRYSEEEGFTWQNDGKYKNMLDVGTMWYARISFVLFVVTVVVLIVCEVYWCLLQQSHTRKPHIIGREA